MALVIFVILVKLTRPRTSCLHHPIILACHDIRNDIHHGLTLSQLFWGPFELHNFCTPSGVRNHRSPPTELGERAHQEIVLIRVDPSLPSTTRSLNSVPDSLVRFIYLVYCVWYARGEGVPLSLPISTSGLCILYCPLSMWGPGGYIAMMQPRRVGKVPGQASNSSHGRKHFHLWSERPTGFSGSNITIRTERGRC